MYEGGEEKHSLECVTQLPPIPSHNAVPRGVVELIKVLLDALRNVFFRGIDSYGLRGGIQCSPLHFYGHV
ncbi:hypothetical protein CEXT_621661 [Caerostris extrusa]|uniref:Uncharacterized protein n=1 Tax=Caerostris extrusa TaxID=172846 RepID=A0AAV4X9M9_CAEEX|nr:hypothetical protein CEXT_621661 [Caerostris extrusa]